MSAQFWTKVEKTDSCWNWTGATFSRGYGEFGKSIYAHRHSWQLTYGKIPAGVCVLHKCDNRRCVRPDHLFLGTRDDNNKDRAIKGRSRPRKGIQNGRAKLKNDDVHIIRASQMPAGQLATKFSVSSVLISQIRLGKIWRHI